MKTLFHRRDIVRNTLIECAFFDFSKPVVICFNPAGKMLSINKVNSDSHGWSYDFMTMKKINVISINTISENHWFLHPELEDYFNSLSDLLSTFPERLGYGASMGAFGVLKHSNLLNIDRALLYSPQQPKNSHLNQLPNIKNTKYYIVFDPFCLDDKNIVNKLNFPIKQLHFYGVGHQVIESMAKIGYLKTLFSKFYENKIDYNDFYKNQKKKKMLLRYYSYMDRNPTHKNSLKRRTIIKKAKIKFILNNIDQVYVKIKRKVIKSIKRKLNQKI